MPKVIGELNAEVVYEQECTRLEINQCITEALMSYGSIGHIGDVNITVIEDDGCRWCPM